MDAHEWRAIAHIDFRPSFADRGALIAALRAGNGPGFEEASRSSASSSPPNTHQGRWISRSCNS
jgi:hypothetical protein